MKSYNLSISPLLSIFIVHIFKTVLKQFSKLLLTILDFKIAPFICLIFCSCYYYLFPIPSSNFLKTISTRHTCYFMISWNILLLPGPLWSFSLIQLELLTSVLYGGSKFLCIIKTVAKILLLMLVSLLLPSIFLFFVILFQCAVNLENLLSHYAEAHSQKNGHMK